MTSRPPACGCASAPDSRDFICCWCGAGSKYSTDVKSLARLHGALLRAECAAKNPTPRTITKPEVRCSKFDFHSAIMRDERLPFSLRLQNHFHRLAHRAAPAARAWCNAPPPSPPATHRPPPRQIPRVSAAPNPQYHLRQNKRRSSQFFLRQKFFNRAGLAQCGRPAGRENQSSIRPRAFCRRRRPRRDPADLQARAPRQHQAEAVADVEPFELALAADENRAVRQHAVHVAEEQFDPARW
jgi:hypothetical protein